jgi:hypothetical protein
MISISDSSDGSEEMYDGSSRNLVPILEKHDTGV